MGKPLRIRNAKTLQKKSRLHTVARVGAWEYKTVSGTSGSVYYQNVYDDGMTCTCPWGMRGGRRMRYQSGCSHVQAAYDLIEVQKGRRVSAWTELERAQRQHRPMINIGDGVVLTSRKL